MPTTGIPSAPEIIVSGSVLASLLAIIILALNVLKHRLKNPKAARIAGYIESGASAFLRTEYSVIIVFDAAVTVLLLVLLGVKTALAFMLGAALSLASGFTGMKVAVKANARTMESVNGNVSKGLKTALSGGSVTGLSVASLSLLGILILVSLIRQDSSGLSIEFLTGYAMGASLTAIFIQIGGGIFTKSADIGADLVGKLEYGLSEDDPRNPAVIADLVGDNVGDCAGRGADLFETLSGDMVTSMIIGLGFLDKYGYMILLFSPLFLSVGLLSTIISIMVALKISNPAKSFLISLVVSTVSSAVGLYFVSTLFMKDVSLFYAGLSGLIVTLLMAVVSNYYTGVNSSPVKSMYESAKRGAAINMINGFAYGLRGAVIPVFLVSTAAILSYLVTGNIYGLVAANLGTDILIGTVMAWDAFGPIVDNAGGINEICGEGNNGAFDALDAIGNTTKAYTKAFALASGTFTAFIALMTYYYVVGKRPVDLTNPFHTAGLLIGIAIPFLFSSYIMSAVNSTTRVMVDEVRKQFREKPGILSGLETPAYDKCVKIATLNALRQMILPVLIAEAVFLGFGLLFGVGALAGMLIGLLGASAILGIKYILVGGAFDNTKKLFELSGSNDEDLRSAVVTGDTFGDPLKDVAGPSLTILMKSIIMTALTFETILVKYALFPV
ncbi:MAG: sodium-translocating pyrophosphatase [Thermoproteota archaeon]|nr:sodium-translocating pyrophosphatase [Candidatus Brockarchaeota archaeon]